MRRHSSLPSISGMYQSEITMGMRASWSSSHASRPLGAVFTSYPAALANAPSWELDTASSSTTSTGIALTIPTAFPRCLKVVERLLRLAPYALKLVPRSGHVAIPGRGLDLLQQCGQVTRADGRGRRLEGVGRPFDRLGRVAGGRRGQRVEPLRQRLDEGREDPIDRFGRARFFHGAPERGDIHGRRC